MPQSILSFCPKKDLLLQYKYNVIWLSLFFLQISLLLVKMNNNECKMIFTN
jgi:hypothetical protein